MALTRGPHGDFDVLPQRGEEFQETLNGERSGAVAHQRRDMRLLDAENLARFGLRDATLLDEAVDLYREPGLQQLLLWMGKAEIVKNVPAAFLHCDRFPTGYGRAAGFGDSFGHVSFVFPGAIVRRLLAFGE
jgi:hypothetical protein